MSNYVKPVVSLDEGMAEGVYEVTYSSSNGTLVGSNTGTTISIGYTYHQNPNDNIGLGDLVVVSDPGLEVVSAKITD